MTTSSLTPAPELIAKTEVWLNEQARVIPFTRGHPVVHAVTAATHPLPPSVAWYDPKTGEAFIHFDAAEIDIVKTRLEAGVDRATTLGLLYHEMAHSRWSDWLFEPSTRRVMTPSQHVTATLFEEMRVEQRSVNTQSNYRQFLRASLGIIVRHMTETPTTRYEVAHAWALVYGRSITTVISRDEVSWMDDAARTVLGDDDVDYLSDILQEAIEIDGSKSVKRMAELAQEWNDIVGMPPENAGVCCGTAGEAQSVEGDDEGDGKSSASDEFSPPDEDDLSSSAGVANSIEDPPETAEKEYSERVSVDDSELIQNMLERTLHEVEENWDATVIDLANPEEWAGRVFGGKRSKALSEIHATAYHQRHVAETAKALESFVIPAITKVSVASEIPPGRLRTREAVRASAERAKGQMVTARPWEATKRRHSSVRPIVVGIATDTSGSMRWAEEAVADFAFTWANAGCRIGARTAAVTFGDQVLCIAAPGEVMSGVRRKAANGGTEHADQALAALDGGLKFSHQNGAAKLLVIVSDGHLVIAHESLRVIQRLKQFKAGGTKVVWISPTKAGLAMQLERRGLAEVVHVDIPTHGYGSISSSRTFDLIQKAVLSRIRSMTN